MTHSRLFDGESSGDESSPCIGVCHVDAGGLCVGCYRSLREIAAWSSASGSQRAEINLAAKNRRSQRNTTDSGRPEPPQFDPQD